MTLDELKETKAKLSVAAKQLAIHAAALMEQGYTVEIEWPVKIVKYVRRIEAKDDNVTVTVTKLQKITL